MVEDDVLLLPALVVWTVCQKELWETEAEIMFTGQELQISQEHKTNIQNDETEEAVPLTGQTSAEKLLPSPRS